MSDQTNANNNNTNDPSLDDEFAHLRESNGQIPIDRNRVHQAHHDSSDDDSHDSHDSHGQKPPRRPKRPEDPLTTFKKKASVIQVFIIVRVALCVVIDLIALIGMIQIRFLSKDKISSLSLTLYFFIPLAMLSTITFLYYKHVCRNVTLDTLEPIKKTVDLAHSITWLLILYWLFWSLLNVIKLLNIWYGSIDWLDEKGVDKEKRQTRSILFGVMYGFLSGLIYAMLIYHRYEFLEAYDVMNANRETVIDRVEELRERGQVYEVFKDDGLVKMKSLPKRQKKRKIKKKKS